MIQVLFLKFWKELIIGALLAASLMLLYDKVYTSGYEKAGQEYKEYFDEYSKKLDKRIEVLQDFSTVLYVQKEQSDKELKASLQTILVESRKAPLTVVKDGKCTLSPTFLDSYNKAIDRANQK